MTRPDTVVLRAPLTGCIVALEQVPDPVFSQRMVGDGISIDPTSGVLVAPCDGRIAQLHPSAHAVTIATAGGAEIMLHIGLDTVQLKGEGFTPRVAIGAEVRTGEALIDFDPDYVATHARSLLTQIVVTSGARVVMVAAPGLVTAGRDPILEIAVDGHAALGGAAAQPLAAAGDAAAIRSGPIVVSNRDGFHARPAAVLAARARQFSSRVTIELGDRQANAKSVVSLMSLEVARHDIVHLAATGADADAAIRVLAQLIASRLGEDVTPADQHGPSADAAKTATSPPRPAPSVAPRPTGGGDLHELTGVSASPGLAVGTVVQVRAAPIAVTEGADDPDTERVRLNTAIERARAELVALRRRLEASADAARAAIFAAHEELLDDPDLLDIAHAGMAKGQSAAYAWRQAFTTQANRLAGLTNELLAARADDLRDVGQRVLRLVTGAIAGPATYPADAILVAEDLTPSETANLDRSTVAGFCTVAGGATSHVAILARSLALPAIAGIDRRALDIPGGTAVVLDGGKGLLRLNPSPDDVARIRQRQERRAARRRTQMEHAGQSAVTRDGHRVEVAANGGSLADAEQAVAMGADAIGLLRTEFLFLGRTSPPSEDEQTAIYESIVRTLGPNRSLIVRTLDVGGDKPLAYLPIPREDNPFLGERGVRVMLNRPEVMRPQVRAILRASRAGAVRAMIPMVATLDEWRAVRAVFEEERARIGVPALPLGIMVEVPAAAIQAEQFAAEVDFFSIGTNDLTQYTLAMDRGHPRLAPQVDGLHPAVLRLIATTVEAARRHRRWVGVCGGIAGDEQAVPILVGLGVDELSVAASAVPAIKARVREVSYDECVAIAGRALAATTASEVRGLINDVSDD